MKILVNQILIITKDYAYLYTRIVPKIKRKDASELNIVYGWEHNVMKDSTAHSTMVTNLYVYICVYTMTGVIYVQNSTMIGHYIIMNKCVWQITNVSGVF